MNHFKRAWLSVTRRKSKSIILLVLIFVLGNVIAGAFSIQQASKNVEKTIKYQLGANAKLSVDYEKIMEASEKNPNQELAIKPLNSQQIESYAKHESVKYYDYSISSVLVSNKYKYVQSEGVGPLVRQNDSNDGDNLAMFTVHGVQYPKVMLIEEKKMELASGRTFFEEEIRDGKLVVMVSDMFLKENGLSVGDVMVLENNVSALMGTEKANSTRNVTLEIIGTFKSQERKEKKNDSLIGMESMFDNTFLTPKKVALEESMYSIDIMMKENPEIFGESKLTPEEFTFNNVEPVYILNDPNQVEAFKDYVSGTLPEFYKVTTASDSYDSIAGPVKALDSMAQITMVVAISATILILSLVIVLFLRDRKHELGIYLSLGDKRRSVLGQVVIEVLMVAIVAIVALTLSLFSGNMIAKSLSSKLLKPSTDGNMNMMMYDPTSFLDVTEEEVMEAYKVELTAEYIVIFYVIGLTVTVASTIVPIVYITRLNPKKIMM